jgi:hypothetical protein
MQPVTQPDAPAKGRPGLIADLTSAVTESTRSDEVAYFGRLLCQDGTGSTFHPRAATDITTKNKIKGVVVAGFQAVNGEDSEPANHPVSTPFQVLRKGPIWVPLDQDVDKDDDVFVRFAENTGVNEVQSMTPSAVPVSGDTVLSFEGESTPELSYAISAADLQTALCTLTSIGAGNLTVTGTFATTVSFAFTGTLAKKNVALLGVESCTFKSNAGTPEVQTLIRSAVPTKGKTKLKIGSATTDLLAFDASAATITAALEGLVGVGKVVATGGFTSASLVATFEATMGDVGEISTDTNTLAQANDTPVTLNVVETTKGVLPADVTLAAVVVTPGEEMNADSVGMFRADDDDPSNNNSDPKAAELIGARYATSGVKGGSAIVDFNL